MIEGTITISGRATALAFAAEMLDGIKGGFERAARLAINDTLNGRPVAVSRVLQPLINLKSTDIKKEVEITERPSFHHSEGISGSFAVTYDPVAMIKFKPSAPSMQPVTVTMLKTLGPLTFTHFFKARGKYGATIFGRIPGAAKIAMPTGKYEGATIKRGPHAGQPLLRQPMKVKYGVSLMNAIEVEPELLDAVTEDTAEKFEKLLLSKTDFLLSLQPTQ